MKIAGLQHKVVRQAVTNVSDKLPLSAGQKYAKLQVLLLFSGPLVLIGLLDYHLLFNSLTLNKHISPVSFCPALIFNLP